MTKGSGSMKEGTGFRYHPPLPCDSFQSQNSAPMQLSCRNACWDRNGRHSASKSYSGNRPQLSRGICIGRLWKVLEKTKKNLAHRTMKHCSYRFPLCARLVWGKIITMKDQTTTFKPPNSLGQVTHSGLGLSVDSVNTDQKTALAPVSAAQD